MSLVERESGRPLTRAMLLFGIAAALQDIVALGQGGGGMAAGLAVALDLTAVARCWGAQGIGWLLAEALPVILTVHADWSARRTLQSLRTSRASLVEEWG